MSAELQGEFSVNGKTWHFFNAEHMNPMYYRYMTTEEVNYFCNTELSVSDSEPLGEDELGFFVWNEELFDRPVVVIELESSTDNKYEVQAARTNGSGPRPGAAGPMSADEYRIPVESDTEANTVVKELAQQLTPLDIN